MNNIEDDVKAAIEEFGELAHERFTDDKGFLFESNGELNREIVGWCGIKLKPLSELFTHGVKVYGFEQEVKMWEFYSHPELEWVSFGDCSYDDALKTFDIFDVRRKTSAALPFDLDRANKLGDVVENYHETYKQWQVMSRSCIFEMKKYTNKVSEDYVRVQLCEGASIALKADNLRMKYPKKVRFGAWNAKT